MTYLDQNRRILRPANYPPDNLGTGMAILKARSGDELAVLNLQGRVFMPPTDDPFRVADAELAKLPKHIKVIFVDMHCEATSEKVAMGWYLDGRVSAVVGTHTHVPTADETMKEIRMALLEADVNFKVVKQFTDAVKAKAVGEEVFQSLTPGQQVVKIVRDELVDMLGGTNIRLNFASQPPTVIMLVGLQG